MDNYDDDSSSCSSYRLSDVDNRNNNNDMNDYNDDNEKASYDSDDSSCLSIDKAHSKRKAADDVASLCSDLSFDKKDNLEKSKEEENEASLELELLAKSSSKEYENELQKKRARLISKLKSIQSKRAFIQSQTIKTNDILQKWHVSYNTSIRKRTQSINQYQLLQNQIQYVRKTRQKLDSLYVLQDVFNIFHRGHFTTMNGLRLGMNVPAAHHHHNHGATASTTGVTSFTQSLGIGLGKGTASLSTSTTPSQLNTTNIISSHHNATTNNNTNATATATTTTTNSHASTTTTSTQNGVQVPWHEINAGIGMIAFLLLTIQHKLHITSKYTIIPRGSTTKVCCNTNYRKVHHSNNHHRQFPTLLHGVQTAANSTGTGTLNNPSIGNGGSIGFGGHQEWDLYYHPTTFGFFARRNWNSALNILGYCCYEIIQEVKTRLEYLNHVKKESDSNGNTGDKNDGDNDDDDNSRHHKHIQIIIPYDVQISGDWKGEKSVGCVKIGGLDIAFNGDGVAWTKVLRYMATDLKWVIAFLARNVDS